MEHGSQSHTALVDVLETLRLQHSPRAVLRCKFRHYSSVQAIFGQDAAERLISAGERHLAAACPADATIARLRNAELSVVIPRPGSEAALLELMEACLEQCKALEASTQGAPLLLDVAIGAAFAEDATSEPDSAGLLSQALLARVEAERQPGSQMVLAQPQLQDQAAELYRLQSDLQRAIAAGELTAHFQPIVNLRDGRTHGFECLVRWQHPTGGVRSPASFMAAATASGLSAAMDLIVLEASLKAAPKLAEAAGAERPLILSANISAQLIKNPRRVRNLLDLIAAHPLPDSVQLQLELLEEAFNHADCDLDALLEWLAEQQVLIAIDDFGTGYSSLSRLHDLCINSIKVDRSFVQRIDAPLKPSNHLLQTLIAISQDLHITLTAEGIERPEQRDWLLANGVQQGQGFLFSQPLTLQEAIHTLNAERR